MNDPHARFLAPILAEPDVDLHRLIYADALADGDDGLTRDPERAEFIRLQIELALWGNEQARPRAYGSYFVDCRNRDDMPGNEECCTSPPTKNGPDECEYHALRRRERALLGENVSREPGRVQPRYYEWCEQAGIDPMWVLTPGFNIGLERRAADHFKRGFVESLTCSWSDWRTHADAIRRATPLREVTLTTRPIPGQKHTDKGTHFFLASSGVPDLDLTDVPWTPRMPSLKEIIEWGYPGITFHLPTAAERFEMRLGQTNQDFSRQYTRQYSVNSDTPANALHAAGLPRVGDVHPTDRAATLVRLHSMPTNESGVWNVLAYYSSTSSPPPVPTVS